MSDMISAFGAWLLALAKAFFSAIWDFVTDAFVALLDLCLSAIAAALSAIPVPQFLTQYSLSNLMGGIDPSIMYFASHMRLAECFTILAAGFAFRMSRKVITLGQW